MHREGKSTGNERGKKRRKIDGTHRRPENTVSCGGTGNGIENRELQLASAKIDDCARQSLENANICQLTNSLSDLSASRVTDTQCSRLFFGEKIRLNWKTFVRRHNWMDPMFPRLFNCLQSPILWWVKLFIIFTFYDRKLNEKKV